MELPKFISRLLEYGPKDRLQKTLELAGAGNLKVLDIGSGGAKYWVDICKQFGGRLELTLLDPKAPSNLEELSGLATVSHIPGLAPESLKQFESGQFDVVTAFDLIEHLTKESGYSLLYELDRISSKTSIVFTPNGFCPQPPSINNPFNMHISGWTPAELREFGYGAIRGHAGLKGAIGQYGQPKWRSLPLRYFAVSTSPLVRFLPNLSFAFSAVKFHGEQSKHVHDGLQDV